MGLSAPMIVTVADLSEVTLVLLHWEVDGNVDLTDVWLKYFDKL